MPGIARRVPGMTDDVVEASAERRGWPGSAGNCWQCARLRAADGCAAARPLRRGLARRRGPRRIRAGAADFGDRGGGAAFAIGEPHVVDRMLDAMQAGARREHPAGEDALDLALQRDLVDLDESVGVGRLGRRARVADARRDLQRAELHRFVDGDVE